MSNHPQRIAIFCCRPFHIRLAKIIIAEPKGFPFDPDEHRITADITLSGDAGNGVPEWRTLLDLERELARMPYDFFFLYAKRRFFFTVVDVESRARGKWGLVWYTLEESRRLTPEELLLLEALRRSGICPDGLESFRRPDEYFGSK